jgi:hypothetical protein
VDERAGIEAAMDRLLEGIPLRSDGSLTVVALAAEAGVCCPAPKIPILAAFTMPMENQAFRAVSWGRCRLRRPGAGLMAC